MEICAFQSILKVIIYRSNLYSCVGVLYVLLPLALKVPHFTSMRSIGPAALLPEPFGKGADNCTALCNLPATSVTAGERANGYYLDILLRGV